MVGTLRSGLWVSLFGCAACGGIAVVDDGNGGAGGGAAQSGVQTTIAASKSATATRSANASQSTGSIDLCALPVGTPCPNMFPPCNPVPVDGIPCCSITKVCGSGGLAWQGPFCTDNCAQNCELVSNPDQCVALPWCTLGPNGACLSSPPPP